MKIYDDFIVEFETVKFNFNYKKKEKCGYDC